MSTVGIQLIVRFLQDVSGCGGYPTIHASVDWITGLDAIMTEVMMWTNNSENFW